MNLHWLLSYPPFSLILLGLLLLALVVCVLLFMGLRRARKTLEENRSANEMNLLHLRRTTHTDPLTGLRTRQQLLDAGKQELTRCRRYQQPMSVVCLDIDHFNQINRNFGDRVGDSVLSGLAAMINGLIRESDTLSRWGGGSFMLLLPHTSLDQALELGEKLRQQTSHSGLLVDTEVTISLGCATLAADDSIEGLTRRAENALPKAKAEGRNCTLGLDPGRGREALQQST